MTLEENRTFNKLMTKMRKGGLELSEETVGMLDDLVTDQAEGAGLDMNDVWERIAVHAMRTLSGTSYPNEPKTKTNA
jgi:hypothetical protein